MPLKIFTTHLTILQQEGYSFKRFISWWLGHPLVFSVSAKKPLVITSKARLLTIIAFISSIILIIISLITKVYFGTALLLLTTIFTPFIYLFLAILILTPYEKINRQRVIHRTQVLLQNIPSLKVVGITGSFGKTTVKDFLFEILNLYKQTVKTPESYNTIFGIAKVVDLEILSKTKYFLCEMGAYVRGEISEICHMVSPDYAILTAIGSQHLERFKTLDNTTLAKFELIDAVNPQNALVNLDNPLIKQHLSQLRYKNVKTYSLRDSKADFFCQKSLLTKKGVSFRLVYQKKTLDITSPLFGTSNLDNLIAAVSMSLLLGVPEEIIKKASSSLTASPHRLELKKINKAALIDNSFSSNEDGFTTIINDLKKLKGKKVIITPGIIELGQKTAAVHQKLGALSSSVFDEFILVGKSERTLNFAKSLKKTQVTFIENSTNLWPLIDKLSQKYDWILLENDLPDVY